MGCSGSYSRLRSQSNSERKDVCSSLGIIVLRNGWVWWTDSFVSGSTLLDDNSVFDWETGIGAGIVLLTASLFGWENKQTEGDEKFWI